MQLGPILDRELMSLARRRGSYSGRVAVPFLMLAVLWINHWAWNYVREGELTVQDMAYFGRTDVRSVRPGPGTGHTLHRPRICRPIDRRGERPEDPRFSANDPAFQRCDHSRKTRREPPAVSRLSQHGAPRGPAAPTFRRGPARGRVVGLCGHTLVSPSSSPDFPP